MNTSTSASTNTLESGIWVVQATQNTAARAPEWVTLFAHELRGTSRPARAMLVGQHPTNPGPAATLSLPADRSGSQLGEMLRAIRSRIVASGESLLDWSELEHEIAERRGER